MQRESPLWRFKTKNQLQGLHTNESIVNFPYKRIHLGFGIYQLDDLVRWAGKSHSQFPPCSLFDYSGPTFVVKNKVKHRCAKYLVQKVLNWNTKTHSVACWRTGSKPCIPPFVVTLHSGHLSQIDEHYSVHHFTESLRMRRDTIKCFTSMPTGTSRASYINLFWSCLVHDKCGTIVFQIWFKTYTLLRC